MTCVGRYTPNPASWWKASTVSKGLRAPREQSTPRTGALTGIRRPKMTHAEIFNNVMRYLWEDDDPEHYFWIRATGDKLRGTQRINPTNAFDVLAIMFGTGLTMTVKVTEEDDESSSHQVTFEDGSLAVIESHYGLGGGVEII